VSYSLYLFHGVTTNFAGATPLQPFSWPLFAQYLVNFSLSLAFAAGLAYGLYSLVEMPAQRWLRRWLPARVPAAAPAATRLSSAPAISAPASLR
jgi:peptidoglycan/LPS O-acetylase OafA/YrhL